MALGELDTDFRESTIIVKSKARRHENETGKEGDVGNNGALVKNFFIRNIGQDDGISAVGLLVRFVFDPVGGGEGCNSTVLEEWRLRNIGSPNVTEKVVHEIIDTNVDGHQKTFGGRSTVSDDHGFVTGGIDEIAGDVPSRQRENQGLGVRRHRENGDVLGQERGKLSGVNNIEVGFDELAISHRSRGHGFADATGFKSLVGAHVGRDELFDGVGFEHGQS
mgnify:CR=1 FL=1